MENEVSLMIFFENIRRLRKREKLSCVNMAKRLNVE